MRVMLIVNSYYLLNRDLLWSLHNNIHPSSPDVNVHHCCDQSEQVWSLSGYTNMRMHHNETSASNKTAKFHIGRKFFEVWCQESNISSAGWARFPKSLCLLFWMHSMQGRLTFKCGCFSWMCDFHAAKNMPVKRHYISCLCMNNP